MIKICINMEICYCTFIIYDCDLQIKTAAQLEAAFAFLSSIASENLKVDEFEQACGVGMRNNSFFFFLL